MNPALLTKTLRVHFLVRSVMELRDRHAHKLLRAALLLRCVNVLDSARSLYESDGALSSLKKTLFQETEEQGELEITVSLLEKVRL